MHSIPSQQEDAHTYSVSICVQEDVAGSSTAEAFGSMPMLSQIMQMVQSL